MKKWQKIICLIFVFFLMASNFIFVSATEYDSDDESPWGTFFEEDEEGGEYPDDEEELGDGSGLYSGYVSTAASTSYQAFLKDQNVENLKSKNPGEQVFTEFFLSVGDYAHNYLTILFKEDITIDKIIFNKTMMLNANFFTSTTNSASSSVSDVVRNFINKWFDVFRSIALVIVMASIVAAGIKIIAGSAEGKTNAREMLTKCVMAVVLIFFFPFVMKYAFDINEAIISYIYENRIGVETLAGSRLSPDSDLTVEELEFRSPQYVSTEGTKIIAGSKEATELYSSKISEYAKSADVMRIMRAYAGVTLRFAFVIVWYILMIQTYMMVFIYVKRYLTIAFLTAIYPLVIIGYVTGYLKGESQNAFNRWCNKYFSAIFLQTIHAIIYGVIAGVAITQVQQAMVADVNNINWLVIIIANSFLFTGEKILNRFWSASTDTERSEMKSILKRPGQIMKKFK